MRFKSIILVAASLGLYGLCLGAEKVAPAVKVTAEAFPLGAVRLLDGPFKTAMELNRKVLLEQVDSDRLLHMFRVTAGLPSTATPYGGWEAPNCELRGHVTGHYLTALALTYAATGDERLKQNGDYIVAELAKCQAALPGKGYHQGFLSAYPEELFDRVDNLQPVWAPYYTLHKIMAGLLDMYVHCGNRQALEVVNHMAGWVKFRCDRLDEDRMQKMLNMEYGGMGEVLANLYAVTGNKDQLALARRFDKKVFFDPLAEGRDNLRALHANTHIPQAIAAAREYELTGEPRYRNIATYFWSQVTGKRAFATGGTSNYEGWRTEPARMASEISVESQESCCTYNMLKLTEHLFEWLPSAANGDYYERALLNGILCTQHPNNGMTMYYVSMKPGHFKVFCTPDHSFWCCTGTGWENHAKYGEAIYFHNDANLWVNQFIASELNWKEKGLTVKQATQFPDTQTSTLTLTARKPLKLALRIRLPYWAPNAVIAVNGHETATRPATDGFAVLDRTWKTGDRVEIRLPMQLHLVPMPDDRDLVAVMYGPMVLAGRLGTENFAKALQFQGDQRAQHGAPSIQVPVLVGAGDDVSQWVKPASGQALTFRTTGVGKPSDVTLVPLHKLYDERYSIYWRRYNAEAYEKMTADAKRDAEITVDRVIPANAESERGHNLQGQDTQAGEFNGGHWRHAQPGGWFSWDLKVLPEVAQVLRCTYWGTDSGRNFNILADGQLIAKVNLVGNKTDTFFSEEYVLPPELLKGKSELTVRFESPEKTTVGGVFGATVQKAH